MLVDLRACSQETSSWGDQWTNRQGPSTVALTLSPMFHSKGTLPHQCHSYCRQYLRKNLSEDTEKFHTNSQVFLTGSTLMSATQALTLVLQTTTIVIDEILTNQNYSCRFLIFRTDSLGGNYTNHGICNSVSGLQLRTQISSRIYLSWEGYAHPQRNPI